MKRKKYILEQKETNFFNAFPTLKALNRFLMSYRAMKTPLRAKDIPEYNKENWEIIHIELDCGSYRTRITNIAK